MRENYIPARTKAKHQNVREPKIWQLLKFYEICKIANRFETARGPNRFGLCLKSLWYFDPSRAPTTSVQNKVPHTRNPLLYDRICWMCRLLIPSECEISAGTVYPPLHLYSYIWRLPPNVYGETGGTSLAVLVIFSEPATSNGTSSMAQLLILWQPIDAYWFWIVA